MDVLKGGFSSVPISIAQFQVVEDEGLEEDLTGSTISVRIIARRAPDGRIEFGMRDQNGEEIFPRARFFPNGGPGHSRWLKSSYIDFGDGFVGRIIARYEADRRSNRVRLPGCGLRRHLPAATLLPRDGAESQQLVDEARRSTSASRASRRRLTSVRPASRWDARWG